MISGHEQSLVSPNISFVRRSRGCVHLEGMRVVNCDGHAYGGIAEVLGIVERQGVFYRTFSAKPVTDTLGCRLDLYGVTKALKDLAEF